ncbi:glycosyltransferase [Rhizobium sp. AQ_MP]|uniref:glycosyltransferase n=1 Tax=Rhizobium sp. AQ_MP TaxID=2761536 RepID=UPI00163B0AFB|nr:glycosyltransferase [Rhizobium sp. AQ_MP]MBC2775889.1 glycosyltransferase [Rhizobium sp. AQ_MP]
MRILLIYWDLTMGGVQHMTTKMANELSARGHEVTIAVAFRAPLEEPYSIDPSVRVVDFDTTRVRHFFLSLRKLMQLNRFDVMFSATTVPNMVAVLARLTSFTRSPLVVSERDNPKEGFKALKSRSERLVWRLKPLLYRGASQIVCVSTPLADALAHFTGIPREKIQVIHNPAEPEGDFVNSSVPHPWLAESSEIPVVIAAGRMHPQKDFPMLVTSFAALLKRRQARLIILGDGPERANVEAAITGCGIWDNVLLPGTQKDIMPWLVHADLFVMSSLFEGFGNVLVQALAAGLRIVSTDCPDGPSEVLEGGRYGRLTPVGDVGAMATAMDEALGEVRDSLRQVSRARDFSVSTIVGRYEKLFQSLGD